MNIGYYGEGNTPLIEDGNLLPYFLDIENLDNRHMFIVGESGSGKTVLLKKLAHGFRTSTINKQKPRVIMTDVQGDLLQMMMSNIIKPIEKTGWQEKLPKKSSHDTIDEMGHFS